MDITRSGVEAITQQLTVEICTVEGVAVPMPAELVYDAADPYAVTVCFGTSIGAVVWTFARDQLVDGLTEPTGDGDVHVWPCLDDDGRAVLAVELCTPDGDALVQLPPDDVAGFVDRMLTAVPIGEEPAYLDLDHLIAEIRAAESL
jgi:hypothetical protein